MKLIFNKLLLLAMLLFAGSAFGQISLNSTKYHQNFDSLAATGTSKLMPYGWYFNTGNALRTTYTADSGINTQANVYSYGDNGNRALGTLGRTGTTPSFGVNFVNSSSNTISSITVAFTTEQWRVASSTGRIDTTKCELSTNASSLSTGTWTREYALDLMTLSSGATGYRIATDPLYQGKVKATITGLSIKPGATFWLRWTDIIVTGANDGLAMDDFSIITSVTQKEPEISFAKNFDVVSLAMDSIKVTMNIIDTNSKAATVSVNINSSSTAKSGTDVLYSGGNYTFSAKTASPLSFYVKVKHDTITKKTKYLYLYLTQVSNCRLYDSLMTIKIFNKDSVAPVISYPISTAKKIGANGYPDTTLYAYWHGVVTSPNFSGSGLFFTITDKTGSITVIAPYNRFKYFPTLGDTVRIKGKVGSLNYLEYISVDSLKKMSSGNPVPNPTNVFALAETTESALVRIYSKVTLVNAALWDTTGGAATGGFVVQVRSAGGPGGNINVFISKYTDLYNTPAPKYPFYITGVNIQDSKTTPNTGYYLFPRFQKDIVQIIPPHYNISQIKGYNKTTGRADSSGVSCFLKGIVQSGNIGTTALSYSLYDFSGAITVVNAKGTGYAPKNGDSIMVLGTVGQTNGLTIITVDSVRIIARNQATKAATVVTKLDEVSESDLVKLKNLSLVDYLLWDTISTANKVSFTIQVTDGTNTYNMLVLRTNDIYFMPAPRYKFNLTGIGSQNDPAIRPLTNYLIIPRSTFDIEKIISPTAKVPEYKIRQVKGYSTNTGVADSINTYCYLRGVVYSKNLGTAAFGFALKDSTGAISNVLLPGYINSYNANIGDSVRVRGIVKQSNGLTIMQIDSVGKLSSTTPLLPGVVSILSEKTESDYVLLHNVQLVNQAEWDTTGGAAKGGITVHVYTTNNDTIPVRLASVNDIFGSPAPIGMFNIAGIGMQQDVTQPFLQGYYLLPRSKQDVSTGNVTNSIASVKENGHVVNVYPNPSSGNVFLNAPMAIQKVELMNIAGKTLQVYYTDNINASLQIKDMPAGIYFIRITANDINETEKLIKY